jgi:23S rRNA (cytidine2498-2'-O)-methyltransferase
MLAAMETSRDLLLYCRAGFERECAQEIAAAEAATRTRCDIGFVEAQLSPAVETNELREPLDWRRLIFARQCLPVFARIDGLSRTDRLAPIIAALNDRSEAYFDVWVEAPDTDAGKALAPFCRSFGNALIGGLKKAQRLDSRAQRRLHAFFPQSDKVYLCAADPLTTAPWPQGIPRLKFPRQAPSRSTLKLEEALLVLLTDNERERWLKPGMSAVDLGAAPGGWTWQLVRRSLRVTAIDNGPMDDALMQSGLVTHRREDGFRFQPRKPVDWLVCDMVEQPRRIAELIARWLAQRWSRHAIFNLKLPMKKRYEETRLCLDLIRSKLASGNGSVDLRAKQLYHDREEITVFARLTSSAGRS